MPATQGTLVLADISGSTTYSSRAAQEFFDESSKQIEAMVKEGVGANRSAVAS